jgi:hypothetical protein
MDAATATAALARSRAAHLKAQVAGEKEKHRVWEWDLHRRAPGGRACRRAQLDSRARAPVARTMARWVMRASGSRPELLRQHAAPPRSEWWPSSSNRSGAGCGARQRGGWRQGGWARRGAWWERKGGRGRTGGEPKKNKKGWNPRFGAEGGGPPGMEVETENLEGYAK